MNFYNEIDRFCADWLQNLIDLQELSEGVVYNKDIVFCNYTDLDKFVHCHFFAGIGGWPLALKLMGWPNDLEVWTGSCPCQPFSMSSQHRRKTADETRHLWPDFLQLIEKHRPPTIFGEQVAGRDGIHWFKNLRSDLESIGYSVVAANLPSACVGAYHIRQRLFWAAYAYSERLEGFIKKRKGIRVSTGTSPTKCNYESLRIWFQDKPDVESICESYGVPNQVGIIRAFGNAIVPQTAALFINLTLDALE